MLKWEACKSSIGSVFRAKVEGGWFVNFNGGTFFYPDPQHIWDGSSLP